MSEAAWFSKGLRFRCNGCGSCCRGEGYVWVSDAEIKQLAELLEIDRGLFERRYLRLVGQRLSLVENGEQDCVFWQGGCKVYEARPTQCRTFPFWPENLESSEAWEAVAETECSGMNCGRLYTETEITRIQRKRSQTLPGPDRTSGRDRCDC